MLDFLTNEDHKNILNLICGKTGLDINTPFNIFTVSNIYQYGSRVYGCNSSCSDYDVIMVSEYYEGKAELDEDEISCTLYGITQFKEQLKKHEISALECLYLPEDKVLKSWINFDHKISLPALRKSISAKASNSFVKAKKKLTVKKDYDKYIGLKSLFHSLRIIMFGIQIATHGKIIDYTAANDYWSSILSEPQSDWEYLKAKYKPIHNQLMTEFRKLAPKE